MKNNDVKYIQKIIEYCDIVDSLLDDYEDVKELIEADKEIKNGEYVEFNERII